MLRLSVILLLACLSSVAFAYQLRITVPHHLSAVSDDLVSAINRLNSTWKAVNNFRGYNLRDLKILMGTFRNAVPKELPLKSLSDFDLSEPIPDEFDARTQWPECAAVIGHVRDQGACGSCWAVAAAGAISDRACIFSKGTHQELISHDDLLSCCGLSCGMGCNGGYPASALHYWKRKGLVTGGDFGDGTTCRPYEIPPCEHHTTGPRANCSGEDYSTPRCVRHCQSSYNGTYNNDRHFASKTYSLDASEEAIQREIMAGGTVEVAFDVMSDFPSYKSGVYQSHSSQLLGGHAVKMIGWGVDEYQNVKYWLCVNSWNTDWGDNGYFKILRGVNECGIEDGAVSGVPR